MKNKCYIFFFAALLAGSLLTSCKDDDDKEYAMSNQDFVARASSSNNFEVAAGGLAVSNAQNAEVKHYGEHMVNDHTSEALEMKNVASKKGWSVPDGLQANHQANLAILATLSGTAFDREFAKMMVKSHQEAVALFETASANTGVLDGDLRAMASGKLPKLKAHLEEAVLLSSAVNP